MPTTSPHQSRNGNAFVATAVEMTFREMDCVAELHHLPQRVGTVAEELQNARHLLAAWLCAPLVVDLRHFPGRVTIFNDLDLGFVVRHRKPSLVPKLLAILHRFRRNRIHPRA